MLANDLRASVSVGQDDQVGDIEGQYRIVVLILQTRQPGLNKFGLI